MTKLERLQYIKEGLRQKLAEVELEIAREEIRLREERSGPPVVCDYCYEKEVGVGAIAPL